MATTPLFSSTPLMGWDVITAANTAKDGTGTVLTVFTGPATIGAFVSGLRFRPRGTNALTVCRVFINNGSTNATAANNTLFDEITLLATTLSETGALTGYDMPINRHIPALYKINITLGTLVAGGWQVTAFGGSLV